MSGFIYVIILLALAGYVISLFRMTEEWDKVENRRGWVIGAFIFATGGALAAMLNLVINGYTGSLPVAGLLIFIGIVVFGTLAIALPLRTAMAR